MYNKDSSKIRFLIGIGTVIVFVSVYLVLTAISPALRTSLLFYRNIIGSYLSFFIPINIISWLCLGQLGGILILIFSCFFVVLTVLKYGVLYYNIYIFLFGVSAVVGYKILSKLTSIRNQSLARLEALEVDENILALKVSKREKDINFAKKRFEGYAALKDITEDLSTTLNLDETVKLIAENAFNIIGRSDRVFLFLIDEEKQKLAPFYCKQVKGMSQVISKRAEIFDSWILKQRKSLIVEDLDNDFRFSAEALNDPGDREFKSIIGVPLMSEMKVMGILRMDSRSKAAYTQDDLRLLDIISDLAAVSVENSQLYKKTNELAVTDGLTGFYVQRYFKERLGVELEKARQGGGKFSILMIDLDYFKRYNDKYGHAAGDLLLVKVAQTIKTLVGPGHIISRYGGEEFAVILFKAHKKSAIEVSEDIRKGIEGSAFRLRRDEVNITVSIGLSSFPEDGDLPESLLKKADGNLYKAKQGGRNTVWPSSI